MNLVFKHQYHPLDTNILQLNGSKQVVDRICRCSWLCVTNAVSVLVCGYGEDCVSVGTYLSMLTEWVDGSQGLSFLALAMSSLDSADNQESDYFLPSKYDSCQQNLGLFACSAPEPDTQARVCSQVHKIT